MHTLFIVTEQGYSANGEKTCEFILATPDWSLALATARSAATRTGVYSEITHRAAPSIEGWAWYNERFYPNGKQTVAGYY